jgi:hypothetical protein
MIVIQEILSFFIFIFLSPTHLFQVRETVKHIFFQVHTQSFFIEEKSYEKKDHMHSFRDMMGLFFSS